MRCLDDRIVYAVGDVHGRLDLLEILIEAVRTDLEACAKPGVLIPLGDYVDRGPDCRGVIERLIALAEESWIRAAPLRGNHEQLMLDFLEHPESGRNWMTLGGAATLASYGVLPPRRNADANDWIEVRNRLASVLPRSHYRLLSTLPFCISAGDYFFVHAGVRPDRPLNAQRQRDMLWIRDSFLRAPDLGFDKVIVHGHSTSTQPMIERARIGIDTGAYATGVLTCLRLEGSARALIRAEAKGVELMALPAF